MEILTPTSSLIRSNFFKLSPLLFCSALLCYAMLCYAMLCYAMLCYAMLCYAMLCYAMFCFVMFHLSTPSSNALPCPALSRLVVSYTTFASFSCPVLSYPLLSRHICHVLSCPVLSCPMSSNPMQCYFIRSSFSTQQRTNYSSYFLLTSLPSFLMYLLRRVSPLTPSKRG